MEYKSEQFRLEVLRKSMEKNFNKIEKIIKYHGQTFKIQPEYLVMILSVHGDDVGRIRYASCSSQEFVGFHPQELRAQNVKFLMPACYHE